MNSSHKISFLLLFSILLCKLVFSQIWLEGVIKDADTKLVLPFVNIGIKSKEIGTSSLSNGTFSIQIPASNQNDTLTFSMVGYSELNIPVSKLKSDKQEEFFLKVKTTQLKTVVVSARKLVEIKSGISAKQLLLFGDGSTNQHDIFEIAQLIKFDHPLSKITSVNLFINEARKDSGIFRINFYGFDGKRPTERILEKSIVEIKAVQAGWLNFDLRKYNLYLKGNFIVAFEFIPSEKTLSPIYYGIKLGGSSKSFVRAHSQGEWVVPPHHYRIFITALVDSKKKKNKDDDVENKESAPTFCLYSKMVKDSFGIFIKLPENYTDIKSKKLPVIFLLDANVYFDIVADEMREKKTKAILVGIGYKDFPLMDSLRNRDYTYPEADLKFGFSISGGADKFLSFIKNELLSFIKTNYPVDSDKVTLAGHSLGGYFTLYALTKALESNEPIFSNYVAASPSLNYSNYIIKQLQNLPGNLHNQETVFITFGAMEDSEDGEQTTDGIDNFNTLVTLLSGKKFSRLKLIHNVFPKFGHMETAIPTFSESLQLIK